MPPAAPKMRLEALVDRAIAALTEAPAAKVWQSAKRLDSFVFPAPPRRGAPETFTTIAALYRDAAGLSAALAGGAPPARVVAFPLLARVHLPTAIPLFEAFVAGDWAGLEQDEEAAPILRAFSEPWDRLAPLVATDTMVALCRAGRVRLLGLTEPQLEAMPTGDLVDSIRRDAIQKTALDAQARRIWEVVRRRAPEALVALWLSGDAPFSALRVEHLAAIPVEGLTRALREGSLGYLHRDDSKRIVDRHPELRERSAQLRLLEALARVSGPARASFGRTAFGLTLIAALAAVPEARPLLLALRSDPELGGAATEALLGAGDRATREALAASLSSEAAARKLAWDPRHTTPELRPLIRARYALDPDASAAAFAPFFAPKAIAREAGAKLAFDILILGRGEHVGTEPWLARDPGWAPILDALVTHPRLGPTAKSCRRLVKSAGAATRRAEGSAARKPASSARRARPR